MFTNTYLPFVGGVTRSVQYFTADLRRMGHKVLVVAPRYDKHTPEDDDELRIPAIRKINGSDFAVRLPVPFVVERRIQEFDPDIIHSHHPFLMGDTALRVARKHNLPLIFTYHTMYEQYIHYLPMHSDSLRHFVRRLSTLYANLCDGVVAPSRSVESILRARGVTSPLVEIPSGVDLDAIERGDGPGFRQEMGIPPDAHVVGHLGRLAPEKNLGFLAAAVARFLARHPRAFFLVAGRGPGAVEIEDICRDSGVAARLVLAGELKDQRVYDAYHAMDLFVFASQTETQGLVLTEAMAAGKPVIALDAPGAREVIDDGVNGRLLPRDSSEEDFSKAVSRFFQQPAAGRKWSLAARQTARRFSRSVCARKMDAFYFSVAADQDRDAADESRIFAWDALRQRLRVEWQLLSQKTIAMAGALTIDWNEQKDGRI